jgi:L1 cell adhesion molecule like protein
MAKAVAIGIDLGTTYTCVGVFQHRRVEIIANDHGNRETPSCVAFTDTDILIGDAAKNQVSKNHNTIFGMSKLKQLCDDETNTFVARNEANCHHIVDSLRIN